MKTPILALAVVAACGGGKPAPQAPSPEPVKEAAAPPPAPEPAPEPPSVPKMLHAKAALAPVKGAKLGQGTVSFGQQEGEDTAVSSDDFDLKPGTYHLVIHDGEDCANPGEPWKGAASVELTMHLTRDLHSLDETKVKLDLGGVAPAVGHVLVLHDDRKGKPAKPLACGAIEAVGATE